ncbi:MAG: hypothetical protein H3C45_12595, partial [Bacteroidia bacterium]|nr:hypothetical protein [Bacteroidia bacterium]
MKKILLGLFLLISSMAYSQTYTNSWIDYSKTYYKINVGQDGLYQIKQADLNAMGLSNIPIEQFQLWRNGKEQILYTSKATGSMSGNDFVQFWGEKNDGKPDTKLYLKPSYQLSDHYSLQTDTSAYFLTVNPSGNNLRFIPTSNNVVGNVLPAEPYFMNNRGAYFNTKLNSGYALPAGDVYVYSSSYDMGEGWTSVGEGRSVVACV